MVKFRSQYRSNGMADFYAPSQSAPLGRRSAFIVCFLPKQHAKALEVYPISLMMLD